MNMRRTLRPVAALATVALIGAGCSSAPSGNGTTDTGSSGSTENAALDKAVKFARCMRDNGVEEFPDPDGSEGLTIDGVVNGSSLDPSAPAWKQAIGACKDLQPPGFTGRKRSAGEQEHALRFAECIRDHGVKDFPDPAKGEPLVNTNLIPSSSTPGGMDILNAAMRACRALGPETAAGR